MKGNPFIKRLHGLLITTLALMAIISSAVTVNADVRSVGVTGNGSLIRCCYVIKDDNSLWMWGNNDYGQLGDGTNTSRLEPVKVMDNVKTMISYSGTNNMAITTDGSLWTWGMNDHGQLGDGTTINRNRPVKILDNVKKCTVTSYFAGAIDNNGQLWMWGENQYGQLGDGTETNRLSPVKVMNGVKVKDLVFGGSFASMALTTDGAVYTWGSNLYYGLGTGEDTGVRSSSPEMIKNDVREIGFIWPHHYLVQNDSSVWTWGRLPNIQSFFLSKAPFKRFEDYKSFTLGGYYGGVIKSNNELWMVGQNGFGQLGIGTIGGQTDLVKVTDNVKSFIKSGNSTTGILKTDDSLWMCGYNDHGQLGNGTNTDVYTPEQIMTDVNTVTSGADRTAVIKNDGSLWMWGSNPEGQLGDGTTADKNRPQTKVMDNVKELYLTGEISAAIKNDGSLWMWGKNEYGQIGDGTTANRVTPFQLLIPGKISSKHVTVKKSKYTYTGKSIKPVPTVIYEGVKLQKSVDYSVTYSKNKAIGTAKITIKGINGYSGTVTKTFKILPDKAVIKGMKTAAVVEGTQIKFKPVTKCKPKYYQIQICKDKNCKKVVKLKKSLIKRTKLKKGKIVGYKKLKKGKTFYVRVRAYNSKTYCGAWSKAVKIKGRG